jgi:NADH:ubiquinone oxidoreductase subunit 3 (subunit A)
MNMKMKAFLVSLWSVLLIGIIVCLVSINVQLKTSNHNNSARLDSFEAVVDSLRKGDLPTFVDTNIYEYYRGTLGNYRSVEDTVIDTVRARDLFK